MNRPGFLRLGLLIVGFAVCAAALLGVAPAVARVNPLTVITRQIKKPNLLVVLDTSGSMNGVPGTPFTYASEVGVDCDDGVDCRGWSDPGTGICAVTRQRCTANADCQKRFCKLGMGACAADSDCPSQGYCTKGRYFCSSSADCAPYAEGICTGSGQPCSLGSPCPPHGNCAETGDGCEQTGRACKTGWCQRSHKTARCQSDRDCPAVRGGDCMFGSTPRGGCTMDSQCAETRRCSTGEACAVNADCPRLTAGTCRVSRAACNSNADCRRAEGGENDGTLDSCVIPDNVCAGEANLCMAEFDKCTYSSGNLCVDVSNTCAPVGNACIIPTPNSCLPIDATNVCQMGSAVPTALRMCAGSQGLCNTDADCPPGDVCGEPSSRTVIAKRTLSRIIRENASLVNLGLMTFRQAGYFPYYPVTTATAVEDRVFLARQVLAPSCYTKVGGPAATCPYQTRSYALAAGVNSRYLINDRGRSKIVEAAWCGDVCAIAGQGTGRYDGSYYVAVGATGSLGAVASVQPSYVGKSFTAGASTYRYYDARADYYNGGAAPPVQTADCSAGVCSAACGARWDTSLAPFINPVATPAQVRSGSSQILESLNKASYGGLITFGGTPSGCALENDVARDDHSGAYGYMDRLRASDAFSSCRPNYVLFITDGEANGPGDVACSDPRCSEDDPERAGCTCRAVNAAFHLRRNLGVRTFVVGFSADAAGGSARAINDNVARAGGTDEGNDGTAPFAYVATNETHLTQVLQAAIYDAVKGSYSTSPATAASGTQMAGTIRSSKYALDARIDFPLWEGHLLAYDVSRDPPALAWDANTELRKMNWWERRIFFGTTDGNAIKVRVDPASKAVLNKATLHGLGLGADANDAERIVRFTMGDPAMGNPIKLGAMVNSTPIDVGMPGDETSVPGGHDFFLANRDRANLTYVGADDGMLHAFFTDEVTVSGTQHAAGSEAFAYIPPAMIRTIETLYAQRGQIADPTQHVFGLASSPKVKNLCTSGCSDPTTAVWKTVLVMNEGYGGPGIFMLDITNPVGPDGFADPPVTPMWDSSSPGLRTGYDGAMGLSMSVPGFFYSNTGSRDQYRVLFASGYRNEGGPVGQGRQLLVASAATGTIVDRAQAAGIADGDCAQEYTILADVATAKDFATDQNHTLRAAFVGDTFGKLWRYDGNVASSLSLVKDFGCDHPLHFAPTVVQLDRDDNRYHKNEAYVVQVTNSTLDEDTIAYPPSQLSIFKTRVDDASKKMLVASEFGTGGVASFTTGPGGALCAETTSGGGCSKRLPTSARPTSTPLAILKRDAAGFALVSMWYAPDAASCGKGTTWLTLHEVVGDEVVQKQGLLVGNEPINGPVVVGGQILVIGANGPRNITGDIAATFAPGVASPHPSAEGLFQMLGWMERD